VKQFNPREILGAGSDELDHRFENIDQSGRDNLMRDMKAEDDTLMSFIEHSQLDHWYQAALDLAKQDFTEEVNKETDNGESMREVASRLEEIEKSIKAKARGDADAFLPKANGSSKSRREDNYADNY